MSGKAFLDTNVLVYAFDRDAGEKAGRARETVRATGTHAVISTQVLLEFYVTVTRKLVPPIPEAEAASSVDDLCRLEVVETDAALVATAIARARHDKMSVWDALIVEAALAAGCDRLLTEDLQAGRRFGEMTVENPFA